MRHYSQLPSESFVQRDCAVGGDDCVLVFPSSIGVSWDLDTLWYRSIILRKSDSRVVSVGFSKFMNWTQDPHLYPDPNAHGDYVIHSKEDGSLICLSQHNGEQVVRTRGTESVDIHPTGPEIHGLLDALPLRYCPYYSHEGHTLLWEHCSPSNRIVIAYEKPELVLLEIVRHSDLTYLPVEIVDALAAQLGARRPKRYCFDSIADIVATCQHLKGTEGFVLAYNGNQSRVKIKTAEWLKLNRLKSEIGSLSKLLDLWFTLGRPGPKAFYDHIATQLDFELAEQARPQIGQITVVTLKVGMLVGEVLQAVESWRDKPRKDAAMHILAVYRPLGLQAVAFSALDDKPVADKVWRELMERELERSPIAAPAQIGLDTEE